MFPSCVLHCVRTVILRGVRARAQALMILHKMTIVCVMLQIISFLYFKSVDAYNDNDNEKLTLVHGLMTNFRTHRYTWIDRGVDEVGGGGGAESSKDMTRSACSEDNSWYHYFFVSTPPCHIICVFNSISSSPPRLNRLPPPTLDRHSRWPDPELNGFIWLNPVLCSKLVLIYWCLLLQEITERRRWVWCRRLWEGHEKNGTPHWLDKVWIRVLSQQQQHLYHRTLELSQSCNQHDLNCWSSIWQHLGSVQFFVALQLAQFRLLIKHLAASRISSVLCCSS